MPKLKKSPIFKYGIEITKPFSKAMYAHNDGVATEMRDNILKVWNDNIYKMKEFFDVNAMVDEWNEPYIKSMAPKLCAIQQEVQATGYGS